MKFKTISTGSEGNMYYLKDSKGKTLILEAGLGKRDLLSGLDHDISGVCGCLLSHEHVDHSKGAKYLESMGVSIITSPGTMDALNLGAAYNKMLRHGEQFLVGPYWVLPFNTHHNCEEPLGFVIQHNEMGVMVFATDTSDITQKFPVVNHWLIEANYSETMLSDHLESGLISAPQYQKTKTHLSIEKAANTVISNGMDEVKNVILCHTSLKNSNENYFEKYFARKTGILPVIAQPNLVMDL